MIATTPAAAINQEYAGLRVLSSRPLPVTVPANPLAPRRSSDETARSGRVSR